MLILYQYEECPYCRKVSRAISDLGIEDKVEYRNTRQEPSYRQELIELIDDTQVPCLIVDGMPMLESDDIVAYLYREYGDGRVRPRGSWGLRS